jgi:hypothetical protein
LRLLAEPTLAGVQAIIRGEANAPWRKDEITRPR